MRSLFQVYYGHLLLKYEPLKKEVNSLPYKQLFVSTGELEVLAPTAKLSCSCAKHNFTYFIVVLAI